MQSQDKLAFFCCGDSGYVKQMCAALLIVREKNPDVDLYIISDFSDEDKQKLLEDCGIYQIQTDLSSFYPKHNETWPSQMFWWSVGPQTLYELGYKYSCLIDADVYCTSELDLSWLTDEIEIAATPSSGSLSGNFHYNSGVVFFNNEKMAEKNLFETSVRVYSEISKEENVHDQQVLTGLVKGSPFGNLWNEDNTFVITNLNVVWNYGLIFSINNDQFSLSENLEDLINSDYEKLHSEVNFVHFMMSHPWKPFSKWGGTHGLFKTEDFPKGWVTGKRSIDPRPENRICFVEDWRKEVRNIEDKYNIKLFDEFDNLSNIL